MRASSFSTLATAFFGALHDEIEMNMEATNFGIEYFTLGLAQESPA
jgi:hypothetical protein